jgi:hypothetical protein
VGSGGGVLAPAVVPDYGANVTERNQKIRISRTMLFLGLNDHPDASERPTLS